MKTRSSYYDRQNSRDRINRREFLKLASGSMAMAALASCGHVGTNPPPSPQSYPVTDTGPPASTALPTAEPTVVPLPTEKPWS
ncbi:MAG: twin-arginine translocation signal domain-containing protein, partial [Anaerolineales bacterium]